MTIELPRIPAPTESPLFSQVGSAVEQIYITIGGITTQQVLIQRGVALGGSVVFPLAFSMTPVVTAVPQVL